MIEKPSYEELQRRVEELEEALRESRERYRLLADNISDVLFIRDMNHRFIYISPSVEKLTGYSVEEAMALTMAESYTPRSIELAMEAFSEELSMEKEGQSDPCRVRTIELEGYRKDGSIIWTEAKMTFLRDSNGLPVGILGVSRDITERKQIERAMIKSEERYRSLVEDMPVLVCRFLPDGTLTFVNNSFCNYFGRKKDTLIGQKFFQLIPEKERQAVMARFTLLTRENPVVTYEHRVIGSDGTIHWQHRIDRALFDGAGDLKEYQCLGLDVTQRKRSEKLLQESEERFLQMAHNIQEVFWLFDWIDKRVLYVSPAFEKIWGRSREALYTCYEEWSESIHPDDVAYAQVSFEEAASTGGGHAREYRIICPDGEVRWVSDRAFAIRNANGEVYRMAGITEDITERKLSEQALKESERRYRQIFNHAPAGIYEVDFDQNRWVAVNEVMCEYTGHTKDELLSMSPYDLLSDEGRGIYEQRVRAMKAGQIFSEPAEYIIKTTKRGELWVVANISPVYESGRMKGATAVVHDITERKKAEEALREKEEKFRAIFHGSHDGLTLVTKEGIFIDCNQRALDIFGLESKQSFVARRPAAFSPPVQPDGRRSFDASRLRIDKAIQEGGFVCFEWLHQRKNGETFPAEIILTSYRLGDNIILQANIRDITERKRAEEKLKDSEERLRSLSSELMKTQENERSRISRELHDELGQSLALLKHRVRPIEKVCGAQLSQSRDGGFSAIDLIDQIIDKVRRIARDLNPSILDDLGLIPGIRALAGGLVDEYDIGIFFDIKELSVIFPEETARNIYRICQEALTNIAKHAEASRVTIRVKEDNERASFLIEDDGKGFNLHKVRAKDDKQRGLGLTVMEERAYLMGATLEISSGSLGRGTQILLTVPFDNKRIK